MKEYIKKIIASYLIVLTVLTTPGIFPAFADVFGFGVQTAEAAINAQVNYQGKLTTPGNIPVADGLYHMRFALYTTQTGGVPIWQEDRSAVAGNRATLSNGLFSLMLGSSTAFTGVDFNQTLYLGIEVGGSAGVAVWDGEMSPRKVLGTVPSAFVADTLDGFDSAQFRHPFQSTFETSDLGQSPFKDLSPGPASAKRLHKDCI